MFSKRFVKFMFLKSNSTVWQCRCFEVGKMESGPVYLIDGGLNGKRSFPSVCLPLTSVPGDDPGLRPLPSSFASSSCSFRRQWLLLPAGFGASVSLIMVWKYVNVFGVLILGRDCWYLLLNFLSR